MTARNEDPVRRAITGQAIEWYLRHRDGSLSAAQRAEFLEWLRASPQNTGEYLQIASLWSGCKDAVSDLDWNEAALLEQSGADTGKVISLRTPRIAPAERIRMRAGSRTRSVAAAALVLLFIATVAYWFAPVGLTGIPRIVSVAGAEQRTVHLFDGSVLHMNATTRIKIRFSRQERLIELERGQALFDVAHDPARPFRVRAGEAEVTAVGTQFDVSKHDARKVTVTVVEGKVDVVDHAAEGRQAVAAARTPAATPLRLKAGEQVQIGVPAKLAKPRQVDVRVATAWVRREIVFEGKRLEDVAEQFNRNIAVPIHIDDPELRDLEVSGVFNVYDAESFIDFLRQYDVAVEHRGEAMHVRRLSSSIDENPPPAR